MKRTGAEQRFPGVKIIINSEVSWICGGGLVRVTRRLERENGRKPLARTDTMRGGMIKWARKGEKMPGCLPVLQLTVHPILIRYTMVQSSRGLRVSLNDHVYLLDPESPPKRCGKHTSYQQRAQKKWVSRGDCPERVWL